MITPLALALLQLGCWSHTPLPVQVGHTPVIVIGTLTNISVTPLPPELLAVPDDAEFDYADRIYDHATIRIEQVIKGSDEDLPAAIIIDMPSASNRPLLGTDTRFTVGSYGIWFLNPYQDRWYAPTPMDLKPVAERETIAALVTVDKR